MNKSFLPAFLLLLTACSQGSQDIEGVQSFKYTGGEHQTGRLNYAQRPPVGGPHNPVWQNCGVYDRPLYDEYAVHSMEHGAVWITYQPGLSTAEVATLREAVQGRPYTLLSPYEALKSPIVLSAWNKQLAVTSASDPRIAAFIQKYEQGGEAPEIGAPCSGGYGDTA